MRNQEHAVARLAARQHGVVAFRQLEALGFTKYAVHRRVDAGRLLPLYRGVYAVGHRALTSKGRWLAAVLACGPNAVLSHRAALVLWELRPVLPGPIDVTVLRSGGRSQPGICLHCVRALRAEDETILDAIPVTSVARTPLDYAQTASPQQLRTALEAAERLERLDGRAIHNLLARSAGRATAGLRTALAAHIGPAPWTRSELERAFLALVREGGLPEPQANVIVAGHLVDFHWPAARLVVEVDGYAYHRGRASFEADRRRDLDLQLAGERAIRLTQRRIHTERLRVQTELRALIERTDLL